MKEGQVKKAVQIAREFASKADELLSQVKPYQTIPGSRKSGALRRLSMELSQSLVEMRKP